MHSLFSAAGPPDPQSGLVRRLKCGDPDAFEDFLDLYQGPLYGFVYRLLDDPTEAPDVTQEVFLKVFRRIEHFREDSTLKTWVYRIAVHEASNRRRWFARHRRPEVSVDQQDPDGLSWDRLCDPGESPFEREVRREQRGLIEEALRGLDDRLRAAVVLRDLEEMSYNEIAQTLEISLGTVKSRILRGREALKERLRRLASESLEGASLQTE